MPQAVEVLVVAYGASDLLDRCLEALGGAEINEAKKVLATEATALAHGRPAAEAAADTARRAFEQGEAAESLPSVEVPREELAAFWEKNFGH